MPDALAASTVAASTVAASARRPAARTAPGLSFGLSALAALALLATLVGFGGAAHAQKPADVFKGKVVLAATPFPTGFKSDKAFVAHMKKVDRKVFEYDETGKFDLELMAFFAKPQTNSQFTCRILDITEGATTVADFPIYPAQKETRILASGASINREKFPPDRRYHLVISGTYNGPVLAEARFTIAKSAADKAADKAQRQAEIEASNKAMAE